MFWHVTALLTVGVCVTAALIIGSWFVLDQPAASRDRLDLVKIALAIVGGIGGVVALTVAYRRQHQGEADGVRERHKIYTERYVKAAEQMGHLSAPVRAAGIYAMAELADDWAEGRQLCVDVLCAYARLPHEDQTGAEREVRRTLFRIIRNHLRPDPGWSRAKWSTCRFSFEGAVIESADLSGAELAGDGHMTFHAVRFVGYFNMNGVRLHGGAPLWFTRATFEGPSITFKDADFRGSFVGFDEAEFKSGSCVFTGVRVDGVRDDDAGLLSTGMSRVGARRTGGTVDWGHLPALP